MAFFASAENGPNEPPAALAAFAASAAFGQIFPSMLLVRKTSSRSHMSCCATSGSPSQTDWLTAMPPGAMAKPASGSTVTCGAVSMKPPSTPTVRLDTVQSTTPRCRLSNSSG